MGMSVGPGGGSQEAEVMVEINTTPLIDVMLVLLIMLIITIPIQLHSVNLNMPIGNPPPPTEPPQVITIDVDFDGTVYWNGDQIANKQALEAKMIDAAARPVQPEIHLRPNKLAEYKDVAAVMASAQRLGLVKLGLVGNEQFVK
jgi:biopolymer transport protein ExbD